jgi:LmbE family N-acetylglucosaminyl deacetylase
MAGFGGKCLVVSPHLDDGVMSCGELLAARPGTTVATIFAGMPAAVDCLTSWDTRSGFSTADQAVTQRRLEDAAALGILSARSVWCELCDSQYHCTPSLDTVAAVLHELLRSEEPETVLFPAGLFHSDHELLHQAALSVRARHMQRQWVMYEDALYRRHSGLLQRRLVALAQAGIHATPVASGHIGTMQAKRSAVACYRSQLRALEASSIGYADAFAPEGYWRLEPSPAEAGRKGAME